MRNRTISWSKTAIKKFEAAITYIVSDSANIFFPVCGQESFLTLVENGSLNLRNLIILF
jgi:hypothetical protein